MNKNHSQINIIIFIALFCLANYLRPCFDAIINLGGNCQVGYQLSINGLRKYSLPFDSWITPFDSLFQLLDNQFDGFLERENFILCENDKKEKYVLDIKYQVRMIHDFKLQEDFLNDFDNIATKYQRRINRLMDLLKNSENPLFIRKIITKEQAIKLRNLLYELRQEKPFLLLALDDTEEIQNNWQLDMIRNFYVKPPNPHTWKGDNQSWKDIFISLDLTLSNSAASINEH